MTAGGFNAAYLERRVPDPRFPRQGLTNWAYQSNAIRKPVQSQGLNGISLTVVPWNSYEATPDDQVDSLRRAYGFPDGDVVREFLVSHRTIRTVLKDAIPELHATFGADTIFNLEISEDDDGAETIYAVAIWPSDVQSASTALHDFIENWWLQRMNATNSDLAFVYKLV